MTDSVDLSMIDTLCQYGIITISIDVVNLRIPARHSSAPFDMRIKSDKIKELLGKCQIFFLLASKNQKIYNCDHVPK